MTFVPFPSAPRGSRGEKANEYAAEVERLSVESNAVADTERAEGRRVVVPSIAENVAALQASIAEQVAEGVDFDESVPPTREERLAALEADVEDLKTRGPVIEP